MVVADPEVGRDDEVWGRVLGRVQGQSPGWRCVWGKSPTLKAEHFHFAKKSTLCVNALNIYAKKCWPATFTALVEPHHPSVTAPACWIEA